VKVILIIDQSYFYRISNPFFRIFFNLVIFLQILNLFAEAKQKQKNQRKNHQHKTNNEDAADVNKNSKLRHRKPSSAKTTKFLKLGDKKDKKDEEKSTIKTLKELKLAFTEFYLALVLIQNYQVIFK
jgi:predicted tellurium resistance membrane protein TerC